MAAWLPSIDTLLLAAFVAVMGYVSAKRQRAAGRREQEIDEERAKRGRIAELHAKAHMAILEYVIVQAHRTGSERGEIDRYIMRSCSVMHRIYKELGGNGFVDALVGEMRALPYSDIAASPPPPKE